MIYFIGDLHSRRQTGLDLTSPGTGAACLSKRTHITEAIEGHQPPPPDGRTTCINWSVWLFMAIHSCSPSEFRLTVGNLKSPAERFLYFDVLVHLTWDCRNQLITGEVQ